MRMLSETGNHLGEEGLSPIRVAREPPGGLRMASRKSNCTIVLIATTPRSCRTLLQAARLGKDGCRARLGLMRSWAGPDVVPVRELVPPVWPEKPGKPQKMLHMDFLVDNLEAATKHALIAGPRWRLRNSKRRQRVLRSAGHPFCLSRTRTTWEEYATDLIRHDQHRTNNTHHRTCLERFYGMT